MTIHIILSLSKKKEENTLIINIKLIITFSHISINILFLDSFNVIVLGGTHQEGDFDRSIRGEDSKRIYNGCCCIMPSLKVSIYSTITRDIHGSIFE